MPMRGDGGSRDARGGDAVNFLGNRKVRNRKASAGLAALALGVASLFTATSAQEAQQGTGQSARAVRLSFVDGQVKLAQGNQVLAEQAVANTPLFEGMQLTTADSGKAEIQFEDGSVVRIAPDSMLTLQVLRGAGTTADAELVVNAGLCYFEFQGGGRAGQMSVHFGANVATTSGFTVLRVAVDTPPGSLAVFSGNVHLQAGTSLAVVSSNVATDLHGGESITLNAADPSQYTVAESIEPNSWDEWNSDRDQALAAEASTQTGAPSNLGVSENPAWNDLDANGSWYDVPGQGYIWSPYDASDGDFDPYGYGQWVWTPGYGYVWASGYPWGYMPFTCGVWNFYGGFGWGWAPGMGGCRAWFNFGFYRGPNIGFAPVGYRPIPRPFPPRGPVGPIGHKPIPVVPVNRRTAFANTSFPARDKNAQVTIAGSTVEPLRPLSSRPVYSHEAFTSESNRTAPSNTGVGTRGALSATPGSSSGSSFTSSRPASETRSAPSYNPPPRPAPESHSSNPPSNSPPAYSPPRSSSSSSGSSGSAPHPSSGGGGGGASHSSGGSSGGGGGGSHSGGHR
jgi:hypothetical protein